METNDINQLVMRYVRKLCVAGLSRESVLEYYIKSNLTKYYGDYKLPVENSSVFVAIRPNIMVKLIIDSIYSDSLIIDLIKNEDGISLIGYTSSEDVFNINVNNELVTNNISFKSDDTPIEEKQEVVILHGDANTFRLARKEEGVVTYDGTLTSSSTRGEKCEFFNFQSRNPKKSDSNMFLKKIYDYISQEQVVSIPTKSTKHLISDYTDKVFDALRIKLESTSDKKRYESKKRLSNLIS